MSDQLKPGCCSSSRSQPSSCSVYFVPLVKKVDAVAAFQEPSDHWVEEPDVAEAPEQEHDPEPPPAIHRPLRH